jgi:hypothetical protein
MLCGVLRILLFPWVDQRFCVYSSHARSAFGVVLSGYFHHQSCADA